MDEARPRSVVDLLDLVERDYVRQERRTLDALRARRRHLERLLPDDRLPTASDAASYHDARRSEGAAPATIRHELSALKRGFTLAVRLELVDRVPWIDLPRVENVRDVMPRTEDVRAILRVLDHLDPPVADGVRWATLTGWRRSQVFGLTWREFSPPLDAVDVPQARTKSGRAHRLALSDGLRAVAVARWFARRGAHVFHRGGDPIRTFDGAWRRAVESAGRPELRFHDLRRYFAAAATDAGVPIPSQLRIAGWATDSIHRRYCLSPAEALRDGLDVLTRSVAARLPASG